jgi:hypothetical protein
MSIYTDVNMETTKNEQTQLKTFSKMIKSNYISIHGEKKVAKLFYNLTSEQLYVLMDLYKRFPLLRWNKFGVYLEKEMLISKELNRSFAIHMYINALQHFLDK